MFFGVPSNGKAHNAKNEQFSWPVNEFSIRYKTVDAREKDPKHNIISGYRIEENLKLILQIIFLPYITKFECMWFEL